VPAFGDVEPEGVGEGIDDRHRRVAVAALLDSDEVFDADSRQRRQLRAPQTRDAAPATGGQPERFGSGGVPSGAEEVAERRAHQRQ
jgi:hypothetical protein